MNLGTESSKGDSHQSIESSTGDCHHSIKMDCFQHGGDIHGASRRYGVGIDEITDFSANINPLITKDWILEKLKPYLNQVLHYPDPEYRSLYKVLATELGVDLRHIVIGNGATALIYDLIRILKPNTGRISAPTFAEYEKALMANKVQVQIFYSKEDNYSVDLANLLDPHGLNKGDVIFLCNPNNPTGHFYSSEELQVYLPALAKAGVNLVIDEAFIDFITISPNSGASHNGDDPDDGASHSSHSFQNYSILKWLHLYENVSILRSSTKFYGMPGLRMGYLLCGSRNLAERIRAAMPVWQVNVLAAGILESAIGDSHFAQKTRDFVHHEKLEMTRMLRRYGFFVWESYVNYMIVMPPEAIRENFDEVLEPYKILVRSCDNYRGMPKNIWRLAIRTEHERQILDHALYQILKTSE